MLRTAHIIHRIASKIKLVPRLIIIDYGGFFGGIIGALIGAVGTIGAGYYAWIGVQDQLNAQQHANNVAEFALLEAELEKFYVKLDIIKELDRNSIFAENIPSYKLNDNKEEEAQYRNKLETLLTAQKLSDNTISGLRRGVVGTLGLDYIKCTDGILLNISIINAIDKAPKKPATKTDEHDFTGATAVAGLIIGVVGLFEPNRRANSYEAIGSYLKQIYSYRTDINVLKFRTRKQAELTEKRISDLSRMLGISYP